MLFILLCKMFESVFVYFGTLSVICCVFVLLYLLLCKIRLPLMGYLTYQLISVD